MCQALCIFLSKTLGGRYCHFCFIVKKWRVIEGNSSKATGGKELSEEVN